MPASRPVSLTGTTPVEVYKLKPGTRIKIVRVAAFNSDAAAHRVQIGYSPINPDGTIDTATFTQILPDIPVGAGALVAEDRIPRASVESTATALTALTARLEAAAGAPVDIVVEWEEE